MSRRSCRRIKLGLPILDQLFTAGVPAGSFMLFEGPPGVGKSVFVYTTVGKFLERGEKALILSFDDDPSAILSSLDTLGVETSKYIASGQLGIIDGFYHPLRRSLTVGMPGVVGEVTPGEVNRTLERVEIILEEKGFKECGGLLVIDSLNEIILRADITSVIDFTKALRAEAKSRGTMVIATLHLGMEGMTNLVFALEYVSDVVVEFGFDPNLEQIGMPLRRVRVKKVRGAPHSLNWIPYTITDEGIALVNVGELANRLRALLSSERPPGGQAQP